MIPKTLPGRVLIFLAFFLISTFTFAQKTTSKKSDSKKSSAAANSGTVGLGVKIGDPTGLSVKFYQPKMAIELVLGRPYYYNGRYYNNKYFHNKYYSDRFYKYNKYKGYRFDYYEAGNPLAFQAHFLKSKSTKTAKALSWYLGAGPQVRTYRIHYFYHEHNANGPDYYYDDYHTVFDVGLDGVLGLEYTFSELPMSVFGDVNLYVELADDPLHLELQGGIGVRYNL